MQKQPLLKQIVECLELEAERREYAEIDPAVLGTFMKLGGGAPAKCASTGAKTATSPARSYTVSSPTPLRPPVPVSTPAPAVASKPAIERQSEKTVAAPAPEVPMENLNVETMQFDELEKKAAVCTRCRLHKSRTNPVFGDGDPHAKLMFIGEGPGQDEDAQGIPFVGRAGQLLTKMIGAMQFERKDVYIANIVKCRPPENRAPLDDEAEQCLPYLLRQIELVKPEVIVLLGAVPLKYILGLSGITRIRGNWKEFKGIKVMPTLHPAYLLRNPDAKKDAWEDLQKVMSVFGKKHKATSKS